MATPAAPDAEASAAPPRPPRLSVELAALRARFAASPVTLREVIATLRGRAYNLLLVLLALPFCTPVPVPLSPVLGLVIAVIALRLALGQKPWLPRGLLDRQLPPGFFGRVLAATTGVVRWLEKILRPRLTAVTGPGWLRQVHAFVMFLAAVLLMLPLPIPFTNALPAWSVLLLAAGLIERDGLVIAFGHAVFAAGVGYFIFLGGATHHLWDTVRRWFAG